MKNKLFNVKALAATAMLSASLAIASPALALPTFAATATVTKDQVNVRSDASTSSSIVGQANNGDSLEVGETKTDDTGAAWYQVTLPDGSTGYIRNDFVTVSEDTEEPDESETSSEGDTEEAPAEDEGNDAQNDTGDYQVVKAPDADGNEVYYLYNNAAGERMKISDIEGLEKRAEDAEAAAATAGTKYKVFLIVLAVAVVILLVLCVLLFLRLKDALTNGRRERDLQADRANARRNGRRADNLDDIKKRDERRPVRPGSRSDAYASGSRSGADDGVRRRPADGQGVRRPDGVRTREGVRSSADAQGVRRMPSDDRRSGDMSDRPVRADRGERPERPVRNDRPVRSERPVRSAQDDDVRTTRPVRSAAPQTEAQERKPVNTAPRKPQPRNFAEDDDFDYDFINLDDK